VKKIQKKTFFYFFWVILFVLVVLIVVMYPSLNNRTIHSPAENTFNGTEPGFGLAGSDSSISKNVTIISVSRDDENALFRFSGLTNLPAGSIILYEIWPDDVIARKNTTSDIQGIAGRTVTSTDREAGLWSVEVNVTTWNEGKYFINAWPEQSDTRYGDRKIFCIPLNETIAQGAGDVSGSGEIILFEITPSEMSSGSVIRTPVPTPMVINRDVVIAIALNDTEVRDYIQDGYEIKDVSPHCYIRIPGDGNEYELCFPGVEIKSKNVYLTAYVDMEKRAVNHTATMYIRSPVIAHSDTTSPVPRVSDSERNGT